MCQRARSGQNNEEEANTALRAGLPAEPRSASGAWPATVTALASGSCARTGARGKATWFATASCRRAQRNATAEEGGPSDAELLARHVSGDPDAFGELFARHRDRMWAVAVRALSDPEEAADALQDAMLAAFRSAGSFRGDSAVTTWLHRIVVNAALDRTRRRAARPTTACQDEEALDALATGSQSLAGPSDSTDTAIDVRGALQQLVPEQQSALVLVDMLGYPVADAAQVLGVPEGTLKSRAARGRARLRSRLAHLRPGAPPDDRQIKPAAARHGDDAVLLAG